MNRRVAELAAQLRAEGDPRVAELLDLVEPIAERDARSRKVLDFVVGVSHDLRTPLNAVIGYAELVEEELEGGYAAAMIPDVRRIKAAGAQVLGLVNDLLDLSRLESGTLHLNPEPFDVRELLDDVQATLDAAVAEQGNQLELKVSRDVGEMIADPTRVRQCLLNLLGTANQGTEAGRIELSAERITPGGVDRVHFAVRDTGQGAQGRDLDRVLGLALTHGLVARMGGALEVRGDPGAGTTIDLDLPAETDEL